MGSSSEDQRTFFESLFPNKDIDISEMEVAPSVLEDRNDVILKLHNDPSQAIEKDMLKQRLG